MPLYDDFVDARWIATENSKIIQLSKTIGHVVGVTPVLLTRPAGVRILTVRGELGTIRIRPDDYAKDDQNFTPTNISDAEETIAIPGSHTFETGEGPFQVTAQAPVMASGTSIVIDEGANTFTRTVGSFRSEGFWFTGAGQTFTLTGSSDNDGTFTVATITADGRVMTVDEDIIVGEAAQTDLVITGILVLVAGADLLTNFWIIVNDANTIRLASSLANALAGTPVDIDRDNAQGLFNIGGSAGWAPADPPAAAVANGYGAFPLKAGEEVSFAAPEEITIVGADATAACSYWWGR